MLSQYACRGRLSKRSKRTVKTEFCRFFHDYFVFDACVAISHRSSYPFCWCLSSVSWFCFLAFFTMVIWNSDCLFWLFLCGCMSCYYFGCGVYESVSFFDILICIIWIAMINFSCQVLIWGPGRSCQVLISAASSIYLSTVGRLLVRSRLCWSILSVSLLAETYYLFTVSLSVYLLVTYCCVSWCLAWIVAGWSCCGCSCVICMCKIRGVLNCSDLF